MSHVAEVPRLNKNIYRKVYEDNPTIPLCVCVCVCVKTNPLYVISLEKSQLYLRVSQITDEQ